MSVSKPDGGEEQGFGGASNGVIGRTGSASTGRKRRRKTAVMTKLAAEQVSAGMRAAREVTEDPNKEGVEMDIVPRVGEADDAPRTPNRRRSGQSTGNAALLDSRAKSERPRRKVSELAGEEGVRVLKSLSLPQQQQQQQMIVLGVEVPSVHRMMSSSSALGMMAAQEGVNYGGGDVVENRNVGGQQQLQRKQRKRKRGKKDRAVVDEKLRIKRSVKNMVNRIRLEQNLIDAYAGEGWKGNSREKIRPEKELQRADMQISRCKLSIRDRIRDLDNLGMEGSLEESAFDEQGEIFHEEIFCAKCRSQEASVDNDIILCDGACNRGFHQNCLEPALATADIPPVDESWLCAVCDSKVECLNYINSYLGTDFQVDDPWEKIFPAAGTSNAMGDDWPSEDSEDEDYDPERQKTARTENEAEEQGGEGADALPEVALVQQEPEAEPLLSLSGSESEPEASSASGSGSASSGSDGDDDSASSGVSGDELENSDSRSQKGNRDSEEAPDSSVHVYDPEIPVDASAGDEDIVLGKRQRKPVDYQKLHDEMFGKDADSDEEMSMDDEWGPARRRGPRFRLQGLNGVSPGSNPGDEQDPSRSKSLAGHEFVNGKNLQTRPKKLFSGQHPKRLPEGAAEVLRQEFDEGRCFPDRAAKESLAQRLGISFRQVTCWFQNARHAARKGPGASDWELKEKNAAASSGRRRGRGADDLEVTNGLLIEKLDEVQLKLHFLKQALEAMMAKRDGGSESDPLERPVEHGLFEGGVVMSHSNGKRILYVPVAEVVEKNADQAPRNVKT